MTFLNSRAPSGHRICRHLRCKEMYYTTGVDPDLDEGRVRDAALDDHVYWCQKTCRDRGPGGVFAALDDCSPARDCYESQA